MSISQLVVGDKIPTIVNGEAETWEVEQISADSDTVTLTLRLLTEQNKTTIPVIDEAEYRRQQMLKPHQKILTTVPDGWLND